MENENGNANPPNDDNDINIELDENNEDVTALKENNQKLAEQNKQLFARAKKAEGFTLGDDGKWVKKTPEKPAPVEPPKKPEAQQANLDETQLDYFDLKGYSDSDEVEVFHKIMQKTGMSPREVLKDEYALAKVKAIRDDKAVKDATPSGTKRSGGQTSDLASALAKFEQTGELPDDFTLKSAVINATVDKQNTNKPSWHK